MIIGTAGHIDHGKTLLVKALTGVETDRLKEEKARGITIELGFAYLPLPIGGVLGFVDVPGHERFVHTMLAGSASVDFAMLVVAADDGVMPQTREHLQIIDLLGIRDGIVVLNKADLVDDARRSEVMAQISNALQNSTLAGADILPVSALTGAGIEALRQRLLEEAQSRPERSTRGVFRMSIDRSFTVAGSGTVVTGGVASGAIVAGDRVKIVPDGAEVRVRSVRAQGQEAGRGETGERCALNLVGVEKEAVKRGMWVVDPAQASTTARFDAQVRLLATETRPLRSGATVHLHVGTSAILARAVLLDTDSIAPGRSGIVQFLLSQALPLRFGDRFVLRDAAAERTIGGGSIIDPRGPQRLRRTPERLKVLDALSNPDAGVALQALLEQPPGLVDFDAFAEDRGMSNAESSGVLAAVSPVVTLSGGRRIVTSGSALKDHAAAVITLLTRLHAEHPQLPGINPETLRLAFKPRLSKEIFAALLAFWVADEVIVMDSTTVRLPTHTSSLGAADAKLWARLETLIDASPLRPPFTRDMAEATGQPIAAVRKLCKAMARIGLLVEIAQDRFFRRVTIERLAYIAAELSEASSDKTFTAAEFRDRAGSGRQIGIQILEYFDRHGLTLRRGDVRIVVREPAAVLQKMARRE